MSDDTEDTGFGSPSVPASTPEVLPPVISPVQASFPQNGPTPEEVKAAARAAAAQRQREAEVAERDKKKADFLAKVAEARKQAEPKPHVPQPVAPRIQEQTRREMEEGARQNAVHAERMRTGPIPPRPEKTEGYTTPVHRPADWVPGPNQGQNGARPV